MLINALVLEAFQEIIPGTTGQLVYFISHNIARQEIVENRKRGCIARARRALSRQAIMRLLERRSPRPDIPSCCLETRRRDRGDGRRYPAPKRAAIL